MENRESSKGASTFMGRSQAGGIIAYLGRDNPKNLKKVMRAQCLEPVNLFFITVNPPPGLIVDEELKTTLEELTLPEQWVYVLKRLDGHTNLLYGWFDDLIIVPEKTKQGLIHIHCVGHLLSHRIDTDIHRIFWSIFGVEMGKLIPKEKKMIREHMVHIEPVRDEGIVDYCFDKEEKNYEKLLHYKDSKGNYRFQPLILTIVKSGLITPHRI